MKRRGFLRMLGIAAASTAVPLPELPQRKVVYGLKSVEGFEHFASFGETVIQGGHVKTHIISIDHLTSFNLDTGVFSGSIKPFSSNDDVVRSSFRNTDNS